MEDRRWINDKTNWHRWKGKKIGEEYGPPELSLTVWNTITSMLISFTTSRLPFFQGVTVYGHKFIFYPIILYVRWLRFII